jgi:hypothetical protein
MRVSVVLNTSKKNRNQSQNQNFHQLPVLRSLDIVNGMTMLIIMKMMKVFIVPLFVGNQEMKAELFPIDHCHLHHQGEHLLKMWRVMKQGNQKKKEMKSMRSHPAHPSLLSMAVASRTC